MNPQATLSALHGLHNPPAISWWPLAPGWYVAIALACLAASIALVFVWRAVKRWRLRRLINTTLLHIEQSAANDNDYAAQVSILLRRVVLARFSRQDCAGLQGKAWLNFLTEHSTNKTMDSSVASSLLQGPYSRDESLDRDKLKRFVLHWTRRNL